GKHDRRQPDERDWNGEDRDRRRRFHRKRRQCEDDDRRQRLFDYDRENHGDVRRGFQSGGGWQDESRLGRNQAHDQRRGRGRDRWRRQQAHHEEKRRRLDRGEQYQYPGIGKNRR